MLPKGSHLSWLTALALFAGSAAQANTLIVVEGQRTGVQPEARAQVLRRIEELRAKRLLGARYDDIQFIDPSTQTPEALAQAADGSDEQSDLFVLGAVDADWLKAATSGQEFGFALIESADASGISAEQLLTHDANARSSAFFLGAFEKCWATRGTTQACAQTAVDEVERRSDELGNFLRTDERGYSVSLSSGSAATPAWSRAVPARTPTGPEFDHTDLQHDSIALLSTVLMPALDVSPEHVDTVGDAVSRSAASGWGLVDEIFPHPQGPGPGDQDGETWIDGEAVRYMLLPVTQYLGDQLGAIFDHLQGARLKRTPTELIMSLIFDQEMKLPLLPRKKTLGVGLFVQIPKEAPLHLRMDGNRFIIDGMGTRGKCVRFQVAFPIFPQWVNLRGFAIDLKTGEGWISAAVLDNRVAFVGKVKVYAKKLIGLDLWRTIESNTPFFKWSDLLFR